MKKSIIFYLLILALAGTTACSYFTVPEVRETIASYTEDEFTQDNIYSDIGSLRLRLEEEIEKGSDTFTIYLKDMEIDEISDINEGLDGVFGYASAYHQVGTVATQYLKVEFTIVRTMNSYVVGAILNGEDISAQNEETKELYQTVQGILATQITEDMSDYEKELSIHDYLVKNCVYSKAMSASPESSIYRAYGALVNKDAVCNGYAEAMYILLMCAGVDVQFVVGTADGIDHAWNLVQLDGEWYHLDATWDDPTSDLGENLVHPFFNVTDDMISKTHTWEQQNYPLAHGTKYNYYIANQLYFTDFETYKSLIYEEMVTNGNRNFEFALEGVDFKTDDMQFIFEGNTLYKSLECQTLTSGDYSVIYIEAE